VLLVCAVPSWTPYPPFASGEACTLSAFLFVVLPSWSSWMYVCGAAAVVPLLRLTLALPVPKSEPTAASTSGVLLLYAWMVCKGWREM
jgi:hypothetical protein